MTEIELLIDLHNDAQRQGPGSDAVTKQAIDLLHLREGIHILDVGCGTGSQTITLAEHTVSTITAIDLSSEFIRTLHETIRQKNLSQRITAEVYSMDQLPYPDESFDVIWSEGAIYNIGFEQGLKTWKPLVKKNGYIAVSELSWMTDVRPHEIEQHWQHEYPEINTVSNKIKVIEQCGYRPWAYFVVPEACWEINYYQPMEGRFYAFLERHHTHQLAVEIVEKEREEIRLFRKYHAYYGYGFYLAQNIAL